MINSVSATAATVKGTSRDSRRWSARRSSSAFVALTAVATLGLVGCGHNDDVEAQSSTSATSGKSTQTTTTTSTRESSTSPNPKEIATSDPHTSESKPAPAPVEQPAPAPAPAPAPSAPDAHPEERAAVEKLLNDWANQPSLADSVRFANENTCRRVVEANGGTALIDPSQVPDVPFTDENRAEMGVRSIENFQVNGDTASVEVTTGAPNNARTVTMHFQRENGRWTLCNAAQ